ncbi:MAG: hypothetical protein QOI01_4076 [Mycobacterium sp.]|jgi:hypothetical protein|nr:hypothetical protein [Mycobacterium sp.]
MPWPEPKMPPSLSLRSTVVMLCAVLVAGSAGGLTYLSSWDLAGSLLAGGTAFAGAIVWPDKIVADFSMLGTGCGGQERLLGDTAAAEQR